jgi:hypothetical protein
MERKTRKRTDPKRPRKAAHHKAPTRPKRVASAKAATPIKGKVCKRSSKPRKVKHSARPLPPVKRCPTGCALCGLLVESPHWCVAKYERAHAAFVLGNVRYRQALEYNAAHDEPEHNPPRLGISDLCEWGDWRYAQLHQASIAAIDMRAVARAERRLARLTPSDAARLHWLYVSLGETERQTQRVARSQGLQAKSVAAGALPPLTIPELAYLRA